MEAVNLSAEAVTPRTPGALAAYVPEGAERILHCGKADPALYEALRGKGARQIIACGEASGDGADAFHQGEFSALAAPGGALENRQAEVIISDNDLPRHRNPEPYMKAALRMLVPGGLLVLATPNIQYHRAVRALAEEGWRYEAEGVWSREYLRYFTAIELKNLARDHGFSGLRIVPLTSDPPETLPLDAEGCVRTQRCIIGPLTQAEHMCYLASEIVCLAVKPAR